MNKRRLLALANHLDKLPPSEFDFSVVCGNPDPTSGWKVPARLTPGCGSVGCAMGHAPSVPCIRRAGWRLTKHSALQLGRGRHLTYLDAAIAMFDIQEPDAMYLFTPYGGGIGLNAASTPQRVAEHIRAFVKRGGRPQFRLT